MFPKERTFVKTGTAQMGRGGKLSFDRRMEKIQRSKKTRMGKGKTLWGGLRDEN